MTFNNQKKRIDNIRHAEGANKKYYKRVRIADYISGQAIYNLGDYPARVSAEPTEYDIKLVKSLSENGVKLIQLHEDWNDACRYYGGDKFNAVDREGTRKFVKLCHDNGIKVIAYMSSSFFHRYDPDFREDFSRTDGVLEMNYFSYRGCNHGSDTWREYVMNKMFDAVDYYGFDGIFNDFWYDSYVYDYEKGECYIKTEEVEYNPETSDVHDTNYLTEDGKCIKDVEVKYDSDFEDMHAQIYSEIKKRGGIYKIHTGNRNVPSRDKVYDYIWVGEGLKELTPGNGKEHDGYVVPCLDRHFYTEVSAKTYFAYTIPFLQFPLLKTGRPIKGENTELPNVTYYGGDEQAFYKAVGDYMKEHPEGPYVYSLWSSIPDDPTEFDVWSYYMKLYAPMTTENSIAFCEIRKCDDIVSDIPERVYASMFVNEETYLAVSNLTGDCYTLRLAGLWQNRETGNVSDRFEIMNDSIVFLVKK